MDQPHTSKIHRRKRARLARRAVALTGVVIGLGVRAGASPIPPAEEFGPMPAMAPAAELRWINGDELRGELLSSGEGEIRWASAWFEDPLIVDASVLEAVTFPEQEGAAGESFTAVTTAGDVFSADLAAADASSYVFTGALYGRLRVDREAVYSLGRRVHPNLAFDGSLFSGWNQKARGPVRDLAYKVYRDDWQWTDDFPDLRALVPDQEGRRDVGFFDLEPAGSLGRFGMVFEGVIEVPETGRYIFDLSAEDRARLFVHDRLLVEDLGGTSPTGRLGGGRQAVDLEAGLHPLRVEFVELGGGARLSVGVTGPDGNRMSLVGQGRGGEWFEGPGGRPVTETRKALMTCPMNVPDRFEIELALASSAGPRFALGIGTYDPQAEADSVLRLETWGDELVVVQDKVFEAVQTLGEHQHDLHVRMRYEPETHMLTVFDGFGRSLVKVANVLPVAGESGLFIRNRGSDLVVKQLRVLRRSVDEKGPPVDTRKPRVHLDNGRVLYGALRMEGGRAFVVDAEGAQHDLDVARVDRIVGPVVPLAPDPRASALIYRDGSLIRGYLQQADATRMTLRTGFADVPVACSLAGAAMFRWAPSAVDEHAPEPDWDSLVSASGRLRGILSFEPDAASLRWSTEGAARSVRFALRDGARIERSQSRFTPTVSYDTKAFPSRLVLKNGERIPCRMDAYDETLISMWSPYLSGRSLAHRHLKAIEFDATVDLAPGMESIARGGGWRSTRWGEDELTFPSIDPLRLTRALTVPRFRRGHSPSHVVVARNGDLKRGALVGIAEDRMTFTSGQRNEGIPLERIRRVVDVTQPEVTATDGEGEGTNRSADWIRATLTDGSVLAFVPLESDGQTLRGRSSIYGEVAVPINNLRDLTFGDFEPARFASPFEDWVVRPASEPDFGRSLPPSVPPWPGAR